MKVHKRKCVYALGSLDSHEDSPFLAELGSYSYSTRWKKNPFYSVGTFLWFLMLLLKSKTSTSATHWVIPTQRYFKGEAKVSRRAIIAIWLWWAGYQTWSKEREAGEYDVIERHRQRFSQFHSAGAVELSTDSVTKFFWKRSAKVKEN